VEVGGVSAGSIAAAAIAIDEGESVDRIRKRLLDEKAPFEQKVRSVSYTHLRAHETVLDLVCRVSVRACSFAFRVSSCLLRYVRFCVISSLFFSTDKATTEIYPLHIVGSVRCV